MKVTALFAPAFATILMAGLAVADDSPNANTVLASVNGHDITLGHVIAFTARLSDRLKELDDQQLYQGVLTQLTQEAVLANEIDAGQKSIRIVIENQTRSLLASMVVTDIEDRAMTEDKILAAYEEQYSDFEPSSQYNAAHILVATEAEAKALVGELEGGASFAALAEEKSTGPSGPNGGKLGWFGLGAMVPEFERALTGLSIGSISEPVQTQFGWHVINLIDKRDSPKPILFEVREDLIAELKANAVSAYLENLQGKMGEIPVSETQIDPSFIRKTDLLDQ